MVLRSFEVWVYKVGQAKVLDLVTALFRNSRQFIVGLIIWEEIGENYFDVEVYGGIRHIVFTPDQRRLLEALLACKPLWRMRQTAVPEWHSRSGYRLQPERHGIERYGNSLRQQLQHARNISQEEFEDYRMGLGHTDLPLRLDEQLLRGLDGV